MANNIKTNQHQNYVLATTESGGVHTLNVTGAITDGGGSITVDDGSSSLTVDAPIGNVVVGVSTVAFSPTITGSTSPAYTSGDNVGGKLTLSGFARTSGGTGEITGVVIVSDTIATGVPFDVFFYNADPSNSTFTDNGAQSINSSDLSKLVGIAHCSDVTSDGNCTIHQASNLPLPFVLASGTTGYATVVVRGGPTLAATTDVTIRIRVRQD